MIINPYIYGVATSYDPDAQLFFNAQTTAGVTLTTTQMNAVNQWVVDAKAIGIWTKMKAVYPMVGGSPTSHKFNLKNPLDTNAAFRLAFQGGDTHSSNGYQPNGTNGYADTFLIPSTTLSLNDSHLSLYNRTNATSYFNATKIDGTNLTNISMALTTNTTEYGGRFMDDTFNSVLTPNALGFYIGNRTLSTQKKYYKNGVLGGTFNVNSIALPDNLLRIGTIVGNGYIVYSSGQCAFATIGDGLTDLESQLFYQITEKYQVALSRNINALQSFYYNSAYNNETNAFLFSTQITDNTIQTATNTLVSDLKTAGVFTKMKALYPMVGGTATTHKFNLVNAQDSAAAFALSFVGGVTHSSTGCQPNGTNGYASTFLIPATSLSANSSHVSIYNRTAGSGVINDWGTSGGGLAFATAVSLSGSAYLDCYNSSTNRIVTPNASAIGFFVGSRTSSTSLKLFKNGTQLGTTNVNASVGVAGLTLDIKLFSYNPISNYSNRECAFASIGDGLTDAEVLAYRTAVQTFQTTLGRQV